jgi:hypothetical protein
MPRGDGGDRVASEAVRGEGGCEEALGVSHGMMFTFLYLADFSRWLELAASHI